MSSFTKSCRVAVSEYDVRSAKILEVFFSICPLGLLYLKATFSEVRFLMNNDSNIEWLFG